jgi:hypothetical protein
MTHRKDPKEPPANSPHPTPPEHTAPTKTSQRTSHDAQSGQGRLGLLLEFVLVKLHNPDHLSFWTPTPQATMSCPNRTPSMRITRDRPLGPPEAPRRRAQQAPEPAPRPLHSPRWTSPSRLATSRRGHHHRFMIHSDACLRLAPVDRSTHVPQTPGSGRPQPDTPGQDDNGP